MTDESRRGFLKSAAALVGTTAAATVFPASIERALAIQANNATRSIKDVEHVVILMQENRAFDHYFGTFAGVRGFGDRFTIPLPNGRTVFQQWNGSRIVMPYHLDQTAGNAQRVDGTPHSWGNAQDAWGLGRMTDWPAAKTDRSMGYYKKAEVEFQFALANAFTLCDGYHCGTQTGTNTNRLVHWTGTNGPTGAGVAVVNNEWDGLDDKANGYTWGTYPERLQAAGVTWKVYQNLPNNFTDNPLAGFRQYRAASQKVGNFASGFPYIPYIASIHDKKAPLYKGVANTMPLAGLLAEFKADVKAGKLPQVSWIIAPDTYSEHPGPSSPVQGAWYIQETLNALTAVADVWSKTVLIVNFDENDGFFDHVPPPAVPVRNNDGSLEGATTMRPADLSYEYFTHTAPPGTSGQPSPDGRPYGPGPRVPCYVVSPWSKGGWVNSQIFDHTSVLRFLEARFDVKEPNISAYRRAVSGDMTSCFDFVNPNATVPSLPSRSRVSADWIRLQQDMKAQIPTPAEADQTAPEQDVGIRPSRALPYMLYADAAVASGAIALSFVNKGKVGAVFHVYDKLHLDRVPRRYMVEAGKSLSATIKPDAGQTRYDFWVLGPNGFHRHFRGDFNLPGGTAQARPEVAMGYDAAGQKVTLSLTNTGKTAIALNVAASAYESYAETRTLAAGGTATITRSVAAAGNWYDYTVSAVSGDGFTRRYAGRMETGKDSVSDPARVLAVLASAG